MRSHHTSSFLEDMSSFLIKNYLSSEDIKKCPNVLLFGILNSENMFDSYLLEKHDILVRFFALHLILGGNLDICRRDGLFFSLHKFFLILDGKLGICGIDDLFFTCPNLAQ